MERETKEHRLFQARKSQRNSLIMLIFALTLPFILFAVLYILDALGMLSEGFIEIYTDNTLEIVLSASIVNMGLIALFATYTYRVQQLLKK